MGGNFANGKGNATVFFNCRNADAVLQGTRDFSACSLSVGRHGLDTAAVARRPAIRGASPTSSTARTLTIANAAGDVRPYVGSKDQFNFAPYNYFQRPDTQYRLQRLRPLRRAARTCASTANSIS